MKEHFRVPQGPSSEDAVRRLVAWAGKGGLPSAYLEFLRETNGAEWGVLDEGGDCICLWPADEVPEYNEGYAIQKWLPDVIVIGSDGGDDALALDCSASGDPDRWPVVRVGFGSLDPEEFCIQAPSFAEWAALRFRLVTEAAPAFELPSREEAAADVERLLKDFPEGDGPF